MGNDLSIARSARVSYNADWREHGEFNDNRLVRSLMMRGHTSPFEAVTFTFEVQAPLFVFRQWHRHRTWSYNEVSARYTEMKDLFYVPDPDYIGLQSKDNKQMRVFDENDAKNNIAGAIAEESRKAYRTYEWLISQGTPRELARCVLPVNIYSRMFATVDLHNLFHFITLRSHEHAQYEIRVYADAMLNLIKPIVPVAVNAWIEKISEEVK
jgi:thymidylate synthase (FAD)